MGAEIGETDLRHANTVLARTIRALTGQQPQG
jgi:hypothetical protein